MSAAVAVMEREIQQQVLALIGRVLPPDAHILRDYVALPSSLTFEGPGIVHGSFAHMVEVQFPDVAQAMDWFERREFPEGSAVFAGGLPAEGTPGPVRAAFSLLAFVVAVSS